MEAKCQMRKMRWCSLLVVIVMLSGSGCGISTEKGQRPQEISYEILSDEQVPKELLEQIREKKSKNMELYLEKGKELYLVRGYGKQKSGGYSIRICSLCQKEDGIYLKTDLQGPQNGEMTSEKPTTPYIVIKTERGSGIVAFE